MNQQPNPPHSRTLDADIPELKSFLKPGMSVLDVGCGFGTISLGVADIVKPGEVWVLTRVKSILMQLETGLLKLRMQGILHFT